MHLFDSFYRHLIQDSRLTPWLDTVPPILSQWHKQAQKGEFKKFHNLIGNLPVLDSADIDIVKQVKIESAQAKDDGHQQRIRSLLMKMKPWRKGPFYIDGVHVDTEWRSDWKWERLVEGISPLKGRRVLDIGCGSGYHLWRMRGAGAEFVLGVDPCDLFFAQFLSLQHFIDDHQVQFLPIGVDDLPPVPAFDTVFTMGVLYHRRSPMDFLLQLKSQLAPGGELVLETLVIEGGPNDVLVPGDRYAKMPNVWFIPSVGALSHWLTRCGFKNPTLIALDRTSLDEQRKTEWLDSESLQTFLDPEDHGKTIEGYPAPLRATLIATV